jgi:hypothetical protein
VRGSLSGSQAAGVIANTAGLVTFGSYPSYYLQNDGTSGFYVGDDLAAYNDGIATGKR